MTLEPTPRKVTTVDGIEEDRPKAESNGVDKSDTGPSGTDLNPVQPALLSLDKDIDTDEMDSSSFLLSDERNFKLWKSIPKQCCLMFYVRCELLAPRYYNWRLILLFNM